MQIRENSSVDFEKEGSWFDKDYTKYTILPKASSQDIADLKTLYDALVEEHQKVTINIKAKVKKMMMTVLPINWQHIHQKQ